MASNLFEQLAELEVPPPPAQFDTQLHDRVNRSLVAHAIGRPGLCSGLPWAWCTLPGPWWDLIAFTVTGRYETNSKNAAAARRGARCDQTELRRDR